MQHRTPLAALAAVLVLALLVPAGAQAAGGTEATGPQAEAATGPQAHVARRCGLRGVRRKLGPTYTTSLKARRVGCRKARWLVTAHYDCRVRNGGRDGRCGRVGRWNCGERRSNVIPTQYDARVKCQRGRKIVRYTYTQFT
jgi:hypothetical protein